MTYPSWSTGELLSSSDMNRVGLWRIANTTFTASSSIVVDNCFSSSFDDYRLIISCTSNSGLNSVNLQYRVGGANADTANYFPRGWYNFGTLTSYAPAAQTSWYLFDAGVTHPAAGIVDIIGPNKAQRTVGNASGIEPVNNYAYNFMGIHSLATSYTGFRLVPTAGSTLTGSVTVYGYNKP